LSVQQLHDLCHLSVRKVLVPGRDQWLL
jgi:hypothetical protein